MRLLLITLLTCAFSIVAMAQAISPRYYFEDITIHNGKGAIKVPSGIDTERPAAPINGMIRYNSTTNNLESFIDSLWKNLGGTSLPACLDDQIVIYDSGEALGFRCDDVPAGGIPLMLKGSIVVSNGITNGEKVACADGQILEYDSTETDGFKCLDTPTGTTLPICLDEQILIADSGELLGYRCDDAPVGGVPLMSKGSLLVSDGTTNGEKIACDDGQILEYDSAEVDGFKCLDTPVSGGTDLPTCADDQIVVYDAGEILGFRCDDLPTPGVSLLGKGSILTSDGTNNGEKTACGDGEILEYDSNEIDGFKCSPTYPLFIERLVRTNSTSSTTGQTTVFNKTYTVSPGNKIVGECSFRVTLNVNTDQTVACSVAEYSLESKLYVENLDFGDVRHATSGGNVFLGRYRGVGLRVNSPGVSCFDQQLIVGAGRFEVEDANLDGSISFDLTQGFSRNHSNDTGSVFAIDFTCTIEERK